MMMVMLVVRVCGWLRGLSFNLFRHPLSTSKYTRLILPCNSTIGRGRRRKNEREVAGGGRRT